MSRINDSEYWRTLGEEQRKWELGIFVESDGSFVEIDTHEELPDFAKPTGYEPLPPHPLFDSIRTY